MIGVTGISVWTRLLESSMSNYLKGRNDYEYERCEVEEIDEI